MCIYFTRNHKSQVQYLDLFKFISNQETPIMKPNFLLSFMGQVFLILFSTQSPLYRQQTANQNYLDTICESVRADCSTNSIVNCTSLKEVRAVTYNRAGGVHLSADTPYYIFSVFELFYSGLFSDKDVSEANMLNAHLESAAIESMSRERMFRYIGQK